MDGHNNATVYTYNDKNQLTAITDASGRKLTFTYDENGHVTSITGPKNKKVTYSYESDLLKKVTDTDGTVTSFDYDAEGRLVKQYSANSTEAKPVFTEYQYSGHRLEKAINAKKKHMSIAMMLIKRRFL